MTQSIIKTEDYIAFIYDIKQRRNLQLRNSLLRKFHGAQPGYYQQDQNARASVALCSENHLEQLVSGARNWGKRWVAMRLKIWRR